MKHIALTCLVCSCAALGCAPDLELGAGVRCDQESPCASGYECYRGFCVVDETETDAGQESLAADAGDSPTQELDAGAQESPRDAQTSTLTMPVSPTTSDASVGSAPSPLPSATPSSPVTSPASSAPRTVDAQDSGSPSGPAKRMTLDCAADQSNCKLRCAAESACEISCGEVSNCEVDCAGSCTVSCAQTDNCLLRCKEGARCELDCRAGEGNCEKIRCERGASCLLHCGGRSNCDFEKCDGALLECPNGDLACQRGC